MLLKEIGSIYVKMGEGCCNIFGGLVFCEFIFKDIEYVRNCVDVNENVDCVFKMIVFEYILRDFKEYF